MNILSVDLHGLSLAEARIKFESFMENAVLHNEKTVRIIHGKGKHSDVFPVIKSYIRHWLEESPFAGKHIETVFRGEDGSPYTKPNAGETIVILKGSTIIRDNLTDWEEDEKGESIRNSKRIRAEQLRTLRRKGQWR